MTMISSMTTDGWGRPRNRMRADSGPNRRPGPVRRGAAAEPGAVGGAEPAAHRAARPGRGGGGGRSGNPLHLRAPGGAARRRRDRGGRGEPGSGARRRRPRSVWELLPQVEPALAEWAAFFAAGAAKRAAAEAGLPRAASAQEADELLRDASTFLTVAERALGVEGEPMLPLRSAS